MRWSFHLARVAGIDVRIHVTFFLLLAFYAFDFYHKGGPSAAITGVIFISLVFFCVLLHEFGHALAARRYGIHTPDITLLPIGGLARLERMPDKPMEELVVAVAGPLVNVAICLLLLPFVALDIVAQPRILEHFGAGLLPLLFSANLILVAFNMIPAFPMDGGRVLRALLAMRMDYARATAIAANIGQSLAFAGGLVGLLHGPPLLILVAIFVFFGAQSEASHAQMQSVSSGLRVRDGMVTRFEALPRHVTLHEAVQAVLSTSQHDFPVVNSDGQVCGVLMGDDLIVALRETGATTAVTNVMRDNVPSVNEMMFLDRAFAIMQEAGSPALPVIDFSGKLVGLFTRENMGELMMIHAALARGPRRPITTPPPLPVRG